MQNSRIAPNLSGPVSTWIWLFADVDAEVQRLDGGGVASTTNVTAVKIFSLMSPAPMSMVEEVRNERALFKQEGNSMFECISAAMFKCIFCDEFMELM
jgi:hypothetical protein